MAKINVDMMQSGGGGGGGEGRGRKYSVLHMLDLHNQKKKIFIVSGESQAVALLS